MFFHPASPALFHAWLLVMAATFVSAFVVGLYMTLIYIIQSRYGYESLDIANCAEMGVGGGLAFMAITIQLVMIAISSGHKHETGGDDAIMLWLFLDLLFVQGFEAVKAFSMEANRLTEPGSIPNTNSPPVVKNTANERTPLMAEVKGPGAM